MILATKLWNDNGQIFRLWNAHLGVVQISKAEYIEVIYIFHVNIAMILMYYYNIVTHFSCNN